MLQERRVTSAGAVTRPCVLRLFSDAESLDQARVPLDILVFEVVEEASSLSDELQEPAARVVVFGVDLEMLGQVSNALAQNRDLHFW